MSRTTPSRQALQHLSRLCRASETTISPPSPNPPARHLCLLRRTTPVPLPRRAHQPRLFSTTSSIQIQPSQTTPETDPQNNHPPLPDITNYYTLFPSTLPSGPPSPPPLTQSPTSLTSSSSSSSSPPRFQIPLPSLRKEFLHLQSLHHPDKYPSGTPSHKKSLALSSLINNAYKTLADPLLRAQYLLNLQYEIDVMSEDNSAHPTDQETLMEVMEAQERIEEAKHQQEIDEIKEENKTRIRETEERMGQAFEQGKKEAAKNETVKLKYWRSLQDGLNDWEPGKEVRLIH